MFDFLWRQRSFSLPFHQIRDAGLRIFAVSYVLWRICALVRHKLQDRHWTKLFGDAQLQTACLLVGATSCQGLQWIDVVATEGVWSLAYPAVLASLRDRCIEFAAARVLFVFVQIHGRFHPPSRKIAVFLRNFTFATAIICIATTIGNIAGSELLLTVTIVVGQAFGVLLLVGVQVYIMTVLKPPENDLIKRTMSTREAKSRKRMQMLMRGIQITGLLMILIAAAELTQPHFNSTLLCMWMAFGLVHDTGTLCMCRFFSKSKEDKTEADAEAETTTTGKLPTGPGPSSRGLPKGLSSPKPTKAITTMAMADSTNMQLQSPQSPVSQQGFKRFSQGKASVSPAATQTKSTTAERSAKRKSNTNTNTLQITVQARDREAQERVAVHAHVDVAVDSLAAADHDHSGEYKAQNESDAILTINPAAATADSHDSPR